MAVRTDRAEVCYRVHFMLFSQFRYRAKVMNVDEALCGSTISMAEIEPAHDARHTEMIEATLPCLRITLVDIKGGSAWSAFVERSRLSTPLRPRHGV